MNMCTDIRWVNMGRHYTPLEISGRGSQKGYHHASTRALDMPSAMPIRVPKSCTPLVEASERVRVDQLRLIDARDRALGVRVALPSLARSSRASICSLCRSHQSNACAPKIKVLHRLCDHTIASRTSPAPELRFIAAYIMAALMQYKHKPRCLA